MKNPSKRKGNDIPKVRCRCPRCGKEHNKYIYWTGDSISLPRKFCSKCEDFRQTLGHFGGPAFTKVHRHGASE